jgi:hypothetical protein
VNLVSDRLYKAVFRYDWTSHLDRSKHWTRMGKRVTRWLWQQKKPTGYVNRYVNVNIEAGTSEMVVVFRDANMALMLKLALG